MFYLNAFLWFASMLSFGFGIAMTFWIWRTRPNATPGPRRTDPLVAARIAHDLAAGIARTSVDGRRRDLAPVGPAWSGR